jgi:hypothetical protein
MAVEATRRAWHVINGRTALAQNDFHYNMEKTPLNSL